MFAARLVQFIENHADELSDGLVRKLRASERCTALLERVPEEELRKRAHEIYRNLSEWLQGKTESEIEERYIGLGMRRARQGVPLTAFLWALTLTREHLWELMLREAQLGEPDLLGEIQLLHSLEQVFDRALYFASLGWEMGARQSPEQAEALSRDR